MTRATSGEAILTSSVATVTTRVATIGGGGVANNIAPILKGPNGQIIVGFDLNKGDIVTPGGARRRNYPYGGRFAAAITGKGGGVVAGVGIDGRFHKPGHADSPRAFTQSVTDPGGVPRQQVFLADGLGVRRLTTSEVDCFSPEVIDQGTVAYARADGRLALASFAERSSLQTTSGKLYHLIGHGQSGQVGSTGSATGTEVAVTPAPPFANIYMFNGGIIPGNPDAVAVMSGSKITSLVPAADTVIAPRYGTTGMLETAIMMSQANGRDGVDSFLISGHGVGGTTYQQLKQGTVPYANLMASVAAAITLAAGLGLTYVPLALHWSHGGGNPTAGVSTYIGFMQQLQTDLTTDIGTAMGTTIPTLPMFMCQEDDAQTTTGTLIDPEVACWTAGTTLPNIYVSATEYIDEYADPFHHTSDFYRTRGSNIGKIMSRVLFKGEQWKPVYMLSAVRSGLEVLVTFNVPRPPLVLDINWVVDPGTYGLQWIDSTSSATVVGAKVVATNQIAIRLSNVPTGTTPLIGVGAVWPGNPQIYTDTSGGGSSPQPGRFTGVRSCIRDSDPAACVGTGRRLHNYCVVGHTIAVTLAP